MSAADQLTLDDAPAVAHSETSRAAAHSIVSDKARLLMLVYLAIRSAGPVRHRIVHAPDGVWEGGRTDEELIEVTGLPANTARPRRVQLVQQGRVRDSGQRRPGRSGRMATVWEIEP